MEETRNVLQRTGEKSFLILLLILSGDIELNPGPPKFKGKGDNQPDDKKFQCF